MENDVFLEQVAEAGTHSFARLQQVLGLGEQLLDKQRGLRVLVDPLEAVHQQFAQNFQGEDGLFEGEHGALAGALLQHGQRGTVQAVPQVQQVASTQSQ